MVTPVGLLKAIVIRKSLRSRLSSGDVHHRAIARGMISVAGFLLLTKIVGAAKEMAVAYRFGISAEVDAYVFVLAIVNWPITIWLSVLTVVLVPLFSRIRRESPDSLRLFFQEFLGFGITVGVLLSIGAWLILPLALNGQWTGLSQEAKTFVVQMASAFSILPALGVTVGVLSVWLLSANRHINTLMEGMPALVLLACLVAFPGTSGVTILTAGTIFGVVLQLAALAWLLNRARELPRPRIGKQSKYWGQFWQGFSIMAFGQILLTSVALIDQFFAAHLGTGAIATLSYGNRILTLLMGLGATAVNRATLPIFADMGAGPDAESERVARRWVLLLFVAGVVVVLAGWMLAPAAIKLLFQRGAFTRDDTLAVSTVFRFSLIQLPFYFSSMVLVSFLSSRRLYRVLLCTGILGLLVKMLGNLLLAGPLGVNGIALAWTLVYGCNACFLWVFVTRYWRGRDGQKQRSIAMS